MNLATDAANSCVAKRPLFPTRMRGGGLHDPSETTRGHLAVTVLILCGYNIKTMTALDKFNIAKELKSQVALPSNALRTVPFVRNSSTNPNNMPAAVFQNMFPDPNDSRGHAIGRSSLAGGENSVARVPPRDQGLIRTCAQSYCMRIWRNRCH